MFSHVTVGTHDTARAITFYESVLATLGLELQFRFPERGVFGFTPAGQYRPIFFIATPVNGEPASIGNGTMIGFDAPDRATVDRFYAAALTAGATDEGAPGLRPNYHANFYGCYVRDLDGNKLCCVCHRRPKG